MNLNFDFYTLFITGLQSAEVIVSVIGIIAAIAVAVSMVTKLGTIILPQPNETRVADFLPFDRLLSDGTTIRCTNGSYVRVFKVNGVDLSSATEETIISMFEARKSWIDNMADLQIKCRVITIRERSSVAKNKTDFDNKWLEVVDEKWRESLSRVYKNDHYIILSIADTKDAIKDLNYASQSVLANLNDYGIKVMHEDELSSAEESPFYPFVRVLNPISKPTPKVRGANGFQLKEMLTSDGIHFTGEEGVIRFFSGEKEKYALAMGIRTSGDYMDENMLSSLMSIDCELTILHNINPFYKPKARMVLVQQQKMAEVTSFSSDVVMQYSEALGAIEDSDADHQSLVQYSMSFIIKADSMDELLFGESEIQRICRLFSVTPVRENWIAQATFFNQFPGYDVCGRAYFYLSRIVALAVSFDQYPTGLSKSDWGEGAISVFRTMSGSPYQFQFHVSSAESAVAHCCIVGPTGQGKTTLLTFLAGQAMRHADLKVYFFDRHRGAEIFTHTVKGAYVGFSGERKNVSLNPFDTRDTGNNRAFLRNWLKSITMCQDALSEREASRAITTAFDYLKPEERKLSNLYKSCFSPTGSMRRELYRWVADPYGNIFNADHDSLDLSSNRFVAFDFTDIFDDDVLAAASISYIMHRIQSESTETGSPALIMIDETAPMLKHEMFRDNFIKGLQEGRKKRQAYLCAFQQPNIVDALGVGDAVRGQCKTLIFFRNTQATPESYEKWNLTNSEYDFISGKSYRDCPYAILVKRADAGENGEGESVVLDVNLSGLGPYLKLYNSGIKNVLLVESLVKEYGEDGFVTKYLGGI